MKPQQSEQEDTPTNESRGFPGSLKPHLKNQLFRAVPITPLVYLRIGFGALLFWEVTKFFTKNWIQEYYIGPPIHYTYSCFSWIRPWPGNGMNLHLGVLGIAAFFITAGFFYRFWACVFCIGFTYVFLLEKLRYLNHFYLICLIAFLMILTPANRALSLDVFLKRIPGSRWVSAWSLWLLRFQIGIVYFYAGIAKINSDWLHGEPMRQILHDAANQISAPVLRHESVVSFFSYSGLLYDLFVFPFLLHKKARWFALATSLIFHTTNSQLFNIGIFPWMMLVFTYVLFFDDYLPFGRQIMGAESSQAPPHGKYSLPRRSGLVFAFVGMYVLIQILVPLRLHLYSGNPAWTFDGEQFAWRMMLHSKHATSLRLPVSFTHNGKHIKTEIRFPDDPIIWTKSWHYFPLGRDPDMILQCVHRKAAELRAKGLKDIDIRAVVPVSLNGREPELLIDPNINLANEERHLFHAYDWVMPLTQPLQSPSTGSN